MSGIPGLPEYVRGYRNAAGLIVRALRCIVDQCDEEGRQPTVTELEKLAKTIEAEAHPANVECGAMIDVLQTYLHKRDAR